MILAGWSFIFLFPWFFAGLQIFQNYLAKACSDVEWQMQVDAPQQPADHRAEDESKPERGADEAEALGAALGGRNVGSVSVGHRKAGARHPAHYPREKHQRQRRGDGQQEKVETQAQQRPQ